MPTGLSYKQLDAWDSELLCQAIERVYGSTYPIPEFYDPAYIHAAITEQKLHSIIALDERREVVGCMSTVLEQTGDYTADASALMIAPEYRGQGIVSQLGHHSMGNYQRLGLGGLHLYALALHDLVQNQSQKAGATVTGILPAWFSRQARIAGYDYPEARIGAVTLFMPLASMPYRSVYLPQRHQSPLSDIYTQLNLSRQLQTLPKSAALPASSTYQIESKSANLQQRVIVTRVGADFQVQVAQLLVKARGVASEVVYIDLPLSDPNVSIATEQARDLGFFFGAVMVDRCGGDKLRLQSYAAEVAAPDHMVIASDRARRLRDYILADRPASTVP